MRQDNWEKAFNHMFEVKKDEPFAWGSNDCCIFVADFIAAIAGIDLARGFRYSYHDFRGAARLIRSFGGMLGLAVEFLNKNGFKPNKPQFSQRGDVVLINLKDGKRAFGINAGKYAVFPGKTGIEQIPIQNIYMTWRIS